MTTTSIFRRKQSCFRPHDRSHVQCPPLTTFGLPYPHRRSSLVSLPITSTQSSTNDLIITNIIKNSAFPASPPPTSSRTLLSQLHHYRDLKKSALPALIITKILRNWPSQPSPPPRFKELCSPSPHHYQDPEDLALLALVITKILRIWLPQPSPLPRSQENRLPQSSLSPRS